MGECEYRLSHLTRPISVARPTPIYPIRNSHWWHRWRRSSPPFTHREWVLLKSHSRWRTPLVAKQEGLTWKELAQHRASTCGLQWLWKQECSSYKIPLSGDASYNQWIFSASWQKTGKTQEIDSFENGQTRKQWLSIYVTAGRSHAKVFINLALDVCFQLMPRSKFWCSGINCLKAGSQCCLNASIGSKRHC